MPDVDLQRRVRVLEQNMNELRNVPARLAAVESQIVQLRGEMHSEFSALRALNEETRAEMRVMNEETRAEMRVMNQETQGQMRLLHEEVISRIGLLQEGTATPPPRRTRRARKTR